MNAFQGPEGTLCWVSPFTMRANLGNAGRFMALATRIAALISYTVSMRRRVVECAEVILIT